MLRPNRLSNFFPRLRVAFVVSWLTLLYAPLFASADVQTAGLTATVYDNNTWNNQYNNAPPLPPTTPVVGTFNALTIDHDFDYMPMFGMYEDFVVQYQGNISAPAGDVRFFAEADDGTVLYLDDQLITSDWYDKGGGGSISEPVAFENGVSKSITLWFYENGGGAFVRLWWDANGQWEVVPPSAFSMVPSTTTTTTTEPPTTTTTTTTTTLPQTTTTESTTTTTSSVPPVTTTEPPVQVTNTGGSSSVVPTTTSTTTTIPPETTTTTTIPLKPTASDLNTDAPVAEQIKVIENLVSNLDNYSDQELEALSVALSDAPNEVKAVFEKQVNVFSGKFDKYVPKDSKVSVGTRRAIIAITATSMAVPISFKRK